MAEPLDRTDDAALWRRWRSAGASGAAEGADPDPLLLAAYAEDRLPPDAAEAIEDWLAVNPWAGLDIVAARRAKEAALPAAPEDIVTRAAALVGAGRAEVPAFRRPAPQPRRWRLAAGWGAMAASMLVASLVGFAMGNDTLVTLAGGPLPSFSQELIDPPTGLFTGFDEDSRT